jgi:hypothetical protein
MAAKAVAVSVAVVVTVALAPAVPSWALVLGPSALLLCAPGAFGVAGSALSLLALVRTLSLAAWRAWSDGCSVA